MSIATTQQASAVNDAQALDLILLNDAIVSLYQPIVNLETGVTIGFEALSRGPAGSPLEFPDRLFGAARAVGRLAELDWACRAAAYRGALNGGLLPPLLLFVNVEPEAAFTAPDENLLPLLAEAESRLRIVAEFTERGLVDRPTEVLAATSEWRRAGMSIALDDLTADAAPLSMLSFVRPDILKLDLSLIQGPGDASVGATLITINAWVEHSKTLIVAEGIETESHLRRARSLGADFGQGWMYGRPMPLKDVNLACQTGALLPAPKTSLNGQLLTPYEYVSSVREPRVATKLELLALSRQLELHASTMGPSGVVISTLQDEKFFNERTREIYQGLASNLALVGVIGAGLTADPESGVHGATIEQGDQLAREWNVLTVSPYYSGAMVARDLGDSGPDFERRFNYCITHDPEVVANATQSLIERVSPLR